MMLELKVDISTHMQAAAQKNLKIRFKPHDKVGHASILKMQIRSGAAMLNPEICYSDIAMDAADSRILLVMLLLVYGVLVAQTGNTNKGYAMTVPSDSSDVFFVDDSRSRKLLWPVRGPPSPRGNDPVRVKNTLFLPAPLVPTPVGAPPPTACNQMN